MPARSPARFDDPFDILLRPPIDETPEEKVRRIRQEEEAKQVSHAIDEMIKQERVEKKKKRVVRLLLLGQSESGKSTTLRQFQRLYTPTAFRQELVLWRCVIQLNLLRSIRTILEALPLPPSSSFPGPASPSSPPRRPIHISQRSRSPSRSRKRSPKIPTKSYDGTQSQSKSYGSTTMEIWEEERDHDTYTDELEERITIPAHLTDIKERLAPLTYVENWLCQRLVLPNEDEASRLPTRSFNANGKDKDVDCPWRDQEFFIRPGTAWKGAIARCQAAQAGQHSGRIPPVPSLSASVSTAATSDSPASSSINSQQHVPRGSLHDSHPMNGHGKAPHPPSPPGIPIPGKVQTNVNGELAINSEESVATVLSRCKDDCIAMWNDKGIREVLRRKKIRLEEGSGFFLHDIERIASTKYMPTEDDVLKARLKTVGVSEYRFEMEAAAGRESGTEWRIVDVGGSRSQRPTWAPFFDDVDAIIFLAPISGFDQVLTEDRSVNRLEDSVLLWKSVCSNKLLANVELVLFLNKCDILDQKLRSGVRLAKYVRSFGDRPNDLETASKYFRSKFNAIQREYSPHPRKFYGFCTSVTDTQTTAGILASVRDMVIRQHLKQSKLL